MRENYKSLTQQMQERLNPEHLKLKTPFQEEIRSIQYQDVLLFIRFAMKGVEPEYTSKSIEAGNHVKNHLAKELENVAYKYQGSVMTNTHIKGYSDIDLLCICTKFYSWDSANVNKYLDEYNLRKNLSEVYIKKLEKEKTNQPYTGDSKGDLRNIRLNVERILSDKYMTCEIEKPKSVKIFNRSLHREVDVVTACWYNDVRAIINEEEENRGVQVYNKEEHIKENADFPFVSIKRINDRSAQTNGRLKKMIRFIKNVKSFSDQDIDLSSFDINAICFDIDPMIYQYLTYTELVTILYDQLMRIVTDQSYADNIISVDQREYIFRGKSEKITSIKKLLSEVQQVNFDIPKTILL